MKTVSGDSLRGAINLVEDLDENSAMALMGEFAEVQPTMFVYMMSLEDLFDETEDFQSLIHLAIVIWLTFKNEFGSIPRIMEPDIVEWEQRSIANLGSIDEVPEDELMEKAIEMLAQEIQPVLMHFITEELVSMEEEGELEGGEDAAGQMFPILKMLIELMDDMMNRPRLRIVE